MEKYEEDVLFPNGMSEDWKQSLSMPNWKHKVYYKDEKPYGIVSMGYDMNGVLMINSGTVDNQSFTVGMLKDIIKSSNANDKVVVSSIMKDSAMSRFGRYDDKNKCFYKGL